MADSRTACAEKTADQVFGCETLSVDEVAKACRVHRDTVCRWSTIGFRDEHGRMMILKKTKVGRRVLYTRSDLASFLAKVNSGEEAASA